MTIAALFKQYLQDLFIGRRAEAREIIFNALDRGVTAPTLLTKVIWVAMEQVEELYRRHEISRVTEHMATRINRTIADQLQAHLPPQPKTGKRMVITSGDGELAELGAQIIADLFGAQGWSVWFVGSGVASDEILELISDIRGDILCIYGAQPRQLPDIRRLIETIREIGAHDDMQILVSGGVFNRADGLADEVKADLFAAAVKQALLVVENHPVRVPKPDVPEPGRRRKRKKRQAPAATRKTLKRRKRPTAKV
ncbi:MAG: cobalamin-dependent protein [Phycisphaerae bacterium]|nr:cobalamin-dependent protein [Phycisphaerae bacterium]